MRLCFCLCAAAEEAQRQAALASPEVGGRGHGRVRNQWQRVGGGAGAEPGSRSVMQGSMLSRCTALEKCRCEGDGANVVVLGLGLPLLAGMRSEGWAGEGPAAVGFVHVGWGEGPDFRSLWRGLRGACVLCGVVRRRLCSPRATSGELALPGARPGLLRPSARGHVPAPRAAPAARRAAPAARTSLRDTRVRGGKGRQVRAKGET